MIIDWTEVIIAVCGILITGIVIPLLKNLHTESKARLSADTQATIEYWTEVGVRWAKQWLQSETGQRKKAEVMSYVNEKLYELGIEVSVSDLDRIIEAVYERVKAEQKQIA